MDEKIEVGEALEMAVLIGFHASERLYLESREHERPTFQDQSYCYRSVDDEKQ